MKNSPHPVSSIQTPPGTAVTFFCPVKNEGPTAGNYKHPRITTLPII